MTEKVSVNDFVIKRINDIGDALQKLDYPAIRKLAKETGLCSEMLRRIRSSVSRHKWSYSIKTLVALDSWYLSNKD